MHLDPDQRSEVKTSLVTGCVLEHYTLTPHSAVVVFLGQDTFEPFHEKTGFSPMRKQKAQISFAVTAKLISTFVFTTRIVQSLIFQGPNFQASSYLLWLYRPVCVRPGRKPQRPVFSHRGSFIGTVSEAVALSQLN